MKVKVENVKMKIVTCTAPVNIALVKYWGKRDVDLILPTNASVSVSLAQDQLRAKTTVAISEKFTEDKIWLNGKEESIQTPRIQNLIKEIKQRVKEQQGKSDNDEMLTWRLHICSENNFPTAAGLASSAAGYACLAYSMAQLYGVKGDISDIARRGSGSACRSVYGGFVCWDKGEKDDGSDSIARQIASHNHWPDLRVLILVVSEQKKIVGSTEGMQNTVRTSELMAERLRRVPDRVKLVERAIVDKDMTTLAECAMKESNQLHAVCLDSFPPVFYLTDTSKQIIHLVHSYNKHKGQNQVAYTFDAGANACLYLQKEDVPQIISLVKHFFPPLNGNEFLTGLPCEQIPADKDLLSTIKLPVEEGGLQYIIHTQPGPGPQTLPDDESLLNDDGLPKILVQKRKIECVS